MFFILAEFKICLQKILSEIQIFVNDIQKKYCNANLYQLEDIMGWFAYIEHLYAVLKEFENVATLMNNFLT